MEHYSCSKAIQPNTQTKERIKSQPVRIKDLLKSCNSSNNAKIVSAPIREMSKPERLILRSTGKKNTESGLTIEGSKREAKSALFQSAPSGNKVRRKLNLSFGIPKCSVNGSNSLNVPRKIDTKEVQQLNIIMQSKTEDNHVYETAPYQHRRSFLMQPNTIRDMYLRNHTKKKEESSDKTKTNQPFTVIGQKRYSIIDEEQISNINSQNLADRLVPDREATFLESQTSRTINRNTEDADLHISTVPHPTNNISHSISSGHTPPMIYSDSNANINISEVHCAQHPYSQLANSNLTSYANTPIKNQQGKDYLYEGAAHSATIDNNTLKHTLHEEFQKIYTSNNDFTSIKSNLRNLIRNTEESLIQLKLILSSIEGIPLQQESAEPILCRDNKKITKPQECITDCTVPEVCRAKIDKEVQVQIYSNDHNEDDEFEVIDDQDLHTLNNSGKSLSNQSFDEINMGNQDSNKENCEDVGIVQQLDSQTHFKVFATNLTPRPHNDSFLTLESKLNILHVRPKVAHDLNFEHSKPNIANQEASDKQKLDKSVKEYMVLKSDLNCLETPNVKKFRSLCLRDTNSIPSSMHKTYMSSKVLAELQNLYTESPE